MRVGPFLKGWIAIRRHAEIFQNTGDERESEDEPYEEKGNNGRQCSDLGRADLILSLIFFWLLFLSMLVVDPSDSVLRCAFFPRIVVECDQTHLRTRRICIQLPAHINMPSSTVQVKSTWKSSLNPDSHLSFAWRNEVCCPLKFIHL
jgi:hypothetical protein